jgi:hypothetical protein
LAFNRKKYWSGDLRMFSVKSLRVLIEKFLHLITEIIIIELYYPTNSFDIIVRNDGLETLVRI